MDDHDILKMILTKLDSMEQSTNQRFDQIDHRLDQMDHRLDQMDQRLDKVEGTLVVIQEDIEILKEEGQVTRDSVNCLLEWAEQAQVQVRIPLFKKAE